jgi:hypothetical protein
MALQPALRESVTILRRRLHAVSPRLRVTQLGDQVVVNGASPATVSRILELAAPGRLSFFDWEASALTPNGRPVSSQLAAGNQTALTISQGAASAAPGAPQAGGLSLYDAVALAARQPAVPDTGRLSRPYAQYYLFGRPSGSHRLRGRRAGRRNRAQLRSALPAGRTGPDARRPTLELGPRRQPV